MRLIVTLIFVYIATVTVLFSQASQTGIYNLDLEQRSNGSQLPLEWFQWGSGYTLKVDTVVKNTGRTSVLIEPMAENGQNLFGCVAYSIPAVYESKEIEVRAYFKLNNVAGAIGLLVRVDGDEGILGFENMMGEKIQGTIDWKEFSVKIPYPDGARKIFIGAILSGTGQLWVDDFQVLLDGKDIKEVPVKNKADYKATSDKEFDGGSGITSITFKQSTLNDLDLLGKIWGFLKYHHPAVAAGNYNWDYELFRIAPKVLHAKDLKERNKILTAWVSSLGEVKHGVTGNALSSETKITPDLLWMDGHGISAELKSALSAVQNAKRAGEHYYIDKAPNVGNPVFKNEQSYSSMKYPDAGFRLLALYRYWNIIHYYFPYKNLIDEDWNKVLPEYIPKFINSTNELDYKLTVLELIARVHDTHANIWGKDDALNAYRGKNYAPIEVKFVEQQAVVTRYVDDNLGKATGLKVGDVVERIDGKLVNDIIKEKLSLTPASNHSTKLRNIARDLLRTNQEKISITYSNEKGQFTTEVNTFDTNEINLYQKFQQKDTCFKMLNSEIAYLYPGSLKNTHLTGIMQSVMNTKGLIIDFRCYPADFTVFTLSEYLLPGRKGFVKFSQGSLTNPGMFTLMKKLEVGKANPDYYKGKVIILINEETQSSAEYHTMAFRTAPRATVIGSTTAGADGNVSRFTLPGGITTMISGIGVYNPDGSETQRIGIVPDVEIKPTIAGVRAGEDELLEKAITLINQQ
jgi:C-terminal processing protease CtpA/Prc